ncbi:MAG: DUF1624 domain-containing protein [Flavobacteriaceae bacterium]|nr:DUF1624 domain-containing protein [Flavobacteriaceae bacterium]
MATKRLFFIDALRAFAILMMLQGHFVSGLLANEYRDKSNWIYATWEYFRGNTAPVFFTVTGFVFIYLLLKKQDPEYIKQRIKKGVKRALQVLFWAYFLRFNLQMLIGYGYTEFMRVDVLNCIAISLLLLIGIYKLFQKFHLRFLQNFFLLLGIVIFMFEPWHEQLHFDFLPTFLQNYIDMNTHSIFTIFPWFGYVCIGAFLGIFFITNKIEKYTKTAWMLIVYGALLMFASSPLFEFLFEETGISLFNGIAINNYLFIRLGNVFVTVAIIMLLERFLKNKTFLLIGQKTLTVYIVHFVILYGSWFGLSLYRFLFNSLNPWAVTIGAIIFMALVCYLTLNMPEYKVAAIKFIKSKMSPKLKRRLAKIRTKTFL